MSGGTAIRARMTEKFNAALAPIVFPAERSQKEELYTSLLEQFNEICRKVQKRFESFGTVPADCYTVDSNGQVTFDSEVAEAVFSEAANLYIDDPQQIELYNAALKALSALQELDTLARKYGMYAINRTNYRAMKVRDYNDVTIRLSGRYIFICRIGNEKATVYFQPIALEYRISNNLLQDTNIFQNRQIYPKSRCMQKLAF